MSVTHPMSISSGGSNVDDVVTNQRLSQINTRCMDPNNPDAFALSTRLKQTELEQRLEWAKYSFLYEIISWISLIILKTIYYIFQIGIGRIGIAGIIIAIKQKFYQENSTNDRCGWCFRLSYFLESFSPLFVCAAVPATFICLSEIYDNNYHIKWVVLMSAPALVFAITIIIARYFVSIINLIDKFCCYKSICCCKQRTRHSIKYYEGWQEYLTNKDGYQMLLYIWGIEAKFVPTRLHDEILVLGSVVPTVLTALIVDWIMFDQFDIQCYETGKSFQSEKDCQDILDSNGNIVGCCKVVDETRDLMYILTILVVNIAFFYQLTTYVLISLLAHRAKHDTQRILSSVNASGSSIIMQGAGDETALIMK